LTQDTVESEYDRYLRIAGIIKQCERPSPPFLDTGAAESDVDKIFRFNNININVGNFNKDFNKLNNINTFNKNKTNTNEIDEKIICVGIGSLYDINRQFNKKYPELFALMAYKYENIKFVILGGQEDFETGESIRKLFPDYKVINLTGKTTIIESALILEKALLYIGNDTGTTHLAAIAGCPVITIFSARDKKRKYYPYEYDGYTAMVIRQNAIDCEGCGLHVCAEKNTKCINLIKVAEVFKQAIKIIDKKIK
jgi:heptosyltransferase-2